MRVQGSEEAQELDICIKRKGGLRNPTQCGYRTERMWGVPDYDFEDAEGTIEFLDGEAEVVLKLNIPGKSKDRISRDFLLVLEASEDDIEPCDFDPEGDGGPDCAMLTIYVSAVDNSSSCSKTFDKYMNTNANLYAFAEWKEQFTSILYCNGSPEEQAEASKQDWVYHLLALPWNCMFLVVPPTSFFGGWLAFAVSISGIGLVTSVISDLAEMFGCLLDCPDVVTALTFVALGTSMPDLFASLTAAVSDPTADASIVNVTGSNSVNVFLGLGVPWVCASLYWNFVAERDAQWEQRYPDVAESHPSGTLFVVKSRNIGFCVMIFCILCVLAIMVIIVRRKYLHNELGGPKVPKIA